MVDSRDAEEVPMSRYPTAQEVATESRRVERVYAVLARVYDGFFDWALGPGRKRAVSFVAPPPGGRVLEVGVGTGLSLPLFPADCRVTGIDISEAMLDQARERADALGRRGVELIRMDARALEFPDETFDVVVAPYVISVVPDPERVMAEVRRVCRPGGSVVVVNRFRSAGAIAQTIERLLTPLTCWIGFRLDLPVETVTGTDGLRVEHVERVNLLGMWRLFVLRRDA